MHGKLSPEFRREFNSAVGSLLVSIRQKAGLTLEQVGATLAKAHLEKVKRLEAGEESLHGSDLMELVRIYGEDLARISAEIQKIGEEAKAKYPLPSFPLPGAEARPETQPQSSPPNAP